MSAVHVPREGQRNQDPTKVFKGWEWESGSIFLPPVALFHLAFAILPLACTFLRIYIYKPTSLKFTQLLFHQMTTKIRWLSLLLVEPHWSMPPPLYLEALKRQPPSQGTYPHIVIILPGILVPHYPFQLRIVLLFSPQDSRNDSCFNRQGIRNQELKKHLELKLKFMGYSCYGLITTDPPVSLGSCSWS